jgi:hypothetical protein
MQENVSIPVSTSSGASAAIRAAFIDVLTMRAAAVGRAARDDEELDQAWTCQIENVSRAMSDTGRRDNEGMGLTAAEYVLGVLDASQRRAAERRIGRDPAFAQEVAFWEERLGGCRCRAASRPALAVGRASRRRWRADRATEAKPGFWHIFRL